MSLAQIVLTTNKSVSDVGDYVRKIGQGERGQILQVIVTNADGSAYDLDKKQIIFSENKDSGKFVVDDGKDINSGKFDVTDAKAGKFSYTLQEQVYTESGAAWFSIISNDGKVLDTTRTFRFDVIPSTTVRVNSDNYSSTLAALEAHYQSTIKNTDENAKNLINSLTDKINQAISNGQTDIANQLKDARNKLQQITNDVNNLKSSWNSDFNSRKQKFDELQNQYQSQINQIKQQADQQTKAIQDSAEKAKNDAIDEIKSQRDAAINQANVDFKNKIDALQVDYNSWKNNLATDLNKQLASIKTDITSKQDDVNNANKQIDYIKQELTTMSTQLDKMDFTKFVTGDQFKEAMSKKANGLKVKGLSGDYIMAPDATGNIDGTDKTNGIATFGALSVIGDVLNKTLQDGFKGLGSDRYTNDEIDQIVSTAVDKVKNDLTALLKDKANETELTSVNRTLQNGLARVSALENAGYLKYKKFTSAEDAQKWSLETGGIAIVQDDNVTE